jgi:hypothetical protein
LPIFAAPFREVSEWSKEHAWKVCMAQKVIVGSNPILSAKYQKPYCKYLIYSRVFHFNEISPGYTSASRTYGG